MHKSSGGSEDSSSYHGPLGTELPDFPVSGSDFVYPDDYSDYSDQDPVSGDAISVRILDREDGERFPQPLPRDDVLKSTLPVLLIGRPYQAANLVAPLLRVIARADGGSVILGAIASLTHVTPERGDLFLAGCDAAAVRIADPFSFAFFDDVPGRKRLVRRRWPYQQDSTLSSLADDLWVKEVVDAQRNAGANIILSPGRFLPGVNVRAELDMAVRHSELTSATLLPGEVSAMNLTISTQWLTNDTLRDDLLARLNEHASPILYVRVLWNGVGTGGQPLEIELLRGYRELCEVSRGEGAVLFFPDTDLTGWLTLAWGASGFGTGITTGNRAFVPILSRGGRMVPKERFLERSLLHTILRGEHLQLLGLGRVVECECTYCRMVRVGHPWGPEIQGLHHVCTIAAFVAETYRLSGGTLDGWRAAALEAVEAGANFAKVIADEIALDRGSEPKHLPIWQSILR